MPSLAGAADKAAIDRAVRRGVQFLRQDPPKQEGHDALAGYAMLKAQVPPSDPLIASAIAKVRAKVSDGVYKAGSHHIYEAGVDVMLLEAANPVAYEEEIQAIVNYLVDSQRSGGQWDYPHQDNGGDTSITQYAILGLWAATRSGFEVPDRTWSDVARWLLTTQLRDGQASGAFAYHPLKSPAPHHTMAAAGAGSLYIAALHLPDSKSRSEKPAPKPEPEPMPSEQPDESTEPKIVTRFKTYDILEKIDFSKLGGPAAQEDSSGGSISILEQIKGEAAKPEQEDKPSEPPLLARSAAEAGGRRGLGWLNRFYTIAQPTGSGGPMYYLYGLERTAAMADVTEIAGRDWFADGSDYVISTQQDDGGWNSTISSIPRQSATSYALLFLTKSTSKMMNRQPKDPEPKEYAGTGLLAGGRGLPDLDELVYENGEVKKKEKPKTPLDDLLTALSRPGEVPLEAVQEQIVEQVQIGDREELIRRKDYLLRILDHPDAQVRRTAVWALGRCEDVMIAPHIIRALRDSHVDVMVEAHNALSVLSRQPQGRGLPDSPLADVPETASDAERTQAIEKWQKAAIAKWIEWYNLIRPYDQRDAGSLVVR